MCGEAGSLRGADKTPCAAFSFVMNHPLICADPKSQLPPHETDSEGGREGGREKEICHYQQIRDKMLTHNNSHVPYANLLEYLNGSAISSCRVCGVSKTNAQHFYRRCSIFSPLCRRIWYGSFLKTLCERAIMGKLILCRRLNQHCICMLAFRLGILYANVPFHVNFIT